MNLPTNHPTSSNKAQASIHSVCFYSFDEQDALSRLRLLTPARHRGTQEYHLSGNQSSIDVHATIHDREVLLRNMERKD
jgi:hypothetical protein